MWGPVLWSVGVEGGGVGVGEDPVQAGEGRLWGPFLEPKRKGGRGREGRVDG